MTGRQRVLEALAHRRPRRVPFSWGFGPTPEASERLDRDLAAQGIDWRTLYFDTEDVLTVSPDYIGPPLPEGMDIWGVRRRPVAYAGGHYDEIVEHPLAHATDPSELADYPWPRADWFDFSGFRRRVLQPDPELTKARRLGLVACGRPLEEYSWLTGLECALANLLTNPDLVHAALGRICDFFCEMQRRAADAAGDLIDVVFFADDLAGQQSLLLSRDTYRRMIQPYHRRLISHAKSHFPNARAMYHTDGAVFEILPDLMEAGVEVLEAVQVDAAGMDPERLKSSYGSALCFQGGIAVQSLLPRAEPAVVEAECRRLVEVLGRGGGYIAAPSHAIQVGTPTANVLAMLRGVLGDADYQAALERARVTESRPERTRAGWGDSRRGGPP